MPQNPEQEMHKNFHREASGTIFDRLKDYQSQLEKLWWEGTFAEYVPMAIENPALARTAHTYLYDSIKRVPDLFTSGEYALFGAEKPLGQFMTYMEASAKDGQQSRMMLLFLGPPGGGKSTLVRCLKRNLERYSRTPEGAMYAISDCPMHEDPLHLIPPELRAQFERETGIHVEGSLCPPCHARYSGALGKVKDVKIKRIFLSEADRIGITTIKAGDSKSQTQEGFVGSINYAKLAEIGDMTNPFVYEFNGEMEKGNRGIIELPDFFQLDKQFHKLFLDAVHDHLVKAERFPEFYAYSVYLAHTNIEEFQNWLNIDENKGMKDRIQVIYMGYDLKASDEKKIHQKLIKESGFGRQAEKERRPHLLAPHTLEAASIFGILSRLKESDRHHSKMEKLQIYDGQYLEGVSQDEILQVMREGQGKDEGLTGISPRYIIRCLEQALVKTQAELGPQACLTPIEALKELRDGLNSHPDTLRLDEKEKEKIRGLIKEASDAYDQFVKVEVQEAFIASFRENAKSLADKYIYLVKSYVRKEKQYDQLGNEIPLDDELMKTVELHAKVSQSGKDEFRRQLMYQIADCGLVGKPFTYDSWIPLKRGIEAMLTAKMADIIEGTLSNPTPDPEQIKKLSEVEKRLIEERGYCEHCSRELIKHARNVFKKKGS